MLGQVAWKAQQGVHQREELIRDFGAAGQALVQNLLAPAGGLVTPVDAIQQLLHQCGIKAQRLAHIPDGAAGAITNHGGGQGGPLTAVALVNVLNNLFTPFVLEIHIDVGGLIPVFGDEPFKQQFHIGRVHLGDAQAVTDRGIGCGSPALAKNALAPGKVDDVVDGEKIVFVAQFGNQLQFFANQCLHLHGCARWVTPPFTLPGESRQKRCGCFVFRH